MFEEPLVQETEGWGEEDVSLKLEQTLFCVKIKRIVEIHYGRSYLTVGVPDDVTNPLGDENHFLSLLFPNRSVFANVLFIVSWSVFFQHPD